MSVLYHEKAYAKVNLGLRVLKKRENGYHPLKTVFHKIDLFDEIEIEISDSDELIVNIKGNESYINNGLDLMEKACIAFHKNTNITFKVNIVIKKYIPFQAGLGGGSSDAATLLLTLNKHFNNILDYESMQKLALSIGSDVPFFTSGFDAAFAQGRGEILKEVNAFNYPVIILKKKGDLVSTKEAFCLLDKREEVDESFPSWPLDITLWNKLLVNDFDIIQNIRREEEFKKLSLESDYNSTCGSGSCQFLLFEDEEKQKKFLKNTISYEMLVTKLKKTTLH